LSAAAESTFESGIVPASPTAIVGIVPTSSAAIVGIAGAAGEPEEFETVALLVAFPLIVD
jgi:hypothetical protein